jgi:hypothetical protein
LLLPKISGYLFRFEGVTPFSTPESSAALGRGDGNGNKRNRDEEEKTGDPTVAVLNMLISEIKSIRKSSEDLQQRLQRMSTQMSFLQQVWPAKCNDNTISHVISLLRFILNTL